MAIPTLTVISGPPGAGKTTLAHGLAERIGCPAICRDEIKEGMVLAAGPAFGPDDHDPMNWRTLEAFFAVVDTLVRAEVSTIAEAAFQDRLWNPGLSPLLPGPGFWSFAATSAQTSLERASRIDSPTRGARPMPMRRTWSPLTRGPASRLRSTGRGWTYRPWTWTPPAIRPPPSTWPPSSR